jgi:hypothetical protein
MAIMALLISLSFGWGLEWFSGRLFIYLGANQHPISVRLVHSGQFREPVVGALCNLK